MQISITAVTKNRKFSKKLISIGQLLQPVKLSTEAIITSCEKFDILQLVFIDEAEGYLKISPIKMDSRLLQIEIGIPKIFLDSSGETKNLFEEVKKIVCKAIDASPMQKNSKCLAIEAVMSTPVGVLGA